MPPRLQAAQLREQIEQTLAIRVPGALSPKDRVEPERLPLGVGELDRILRGGVPAGAITELTGPECSGRTTAALSLIAAMSATGGVCGWIDVADTLDPVGAALSGVDLERLLWVRCGRAQQVNQVQLPGLTNASSVVVPSGVSSPASLLGGGSPHPRSEDRGMPEAIDELLRAQPRSGALPSPRRRMVGTPGAPNRPLLERSPHREEQVATDRLPPRRGEHLRVMKPRCAEPQSSRREQTGATGRAVKLQMPRPNNDLARNPRTRLASHGWNAIDQALRASDLLLQSGGFRLLVLDLGSTPPEMSWRIPLATWFRFRAACERTRASLLLLTQHPCARSSAELVMRLEGGHAQADGNVLSGIAYRASMERERFQPIDDHVVPIRKPPQGEHAVAWKGRAAWTVMS